MNTPKEKKCSKCGELRNLEAFSKDKYSKNGLHSVCKCCKNEYNKIYKQKNSESTKTYNKTYKTNNKQIIKKYNHQYYTENIEEIKEYRNSNLDKFAAHASKRRARKRNQLHPDHNPIVEQCLHQQRIRINKCLGIEFEIDHIWPISKGGPHHHENLQLIPATINNIKLADMKYDHDSILEWTHLPVYLLKWIKENSPNEFESAVNEILG